MQRKTRAKKTGKLPVLWLYSERVKGKYIYEINKTFQTFNKYEYLCEI